MKLRKYEAEKMAYPGMPPGKTGVVFYTAPDGEEYAVWVRQEKRFSGLPPGGDYSKWDREDPTPYYTITAREAVKPEDYAEVRFVYEFNELLELEIQEENFRTSMAWADANLSPAKPKSKPLSFYDPDDVDPDDCE